MDVPSRPAADEPPLGFVLARVGQCVMQGFHDLVVQADLHPRHYPILTALASRDGQSQRELSRALHIPASRVVDLVDGLEARGLLTRGAHPTDRRPQVLALTTHGRNVTAELRAAAGQYSQHLTEGLSDGDQAQLRSLLARVAANCGVDPDSLNSITAW